MRNELKGLRRQVGITLMELMTVVAIIGILMAIAVPGYREYMRRGAVAEGLASLSTSKTAMDQYFLDNRTYVGATCPGGTNEFTFTCDPAPTATAYRIVATGTGRVDGFVYTINQAGARTSAGPWGSGSCWVGRKGDSCGGS